MPPRKSSTSSTKKPTKKSTKKKASEEFEMEEKSKSKKRDRDYELESAADDMEYDRPAMSPMTSVLIILVVVMAAVIGYLLWDKSQDDDANTANTSEVGSSVDGEVSGEMVDRIRDVLIVDDGEPTVYSVVDRQKLLDQNPTFYKAVAVGDKLVVFSDTAVIYRPEMNKIINFAPIKRDGETIESIDDVATEGEPAEEEVVEPVAVTIEVQNGTLVAGKAGEMRSTIEALANDLYSVSSAINANNRDYTTSAVYDNTTGDAGKTAAAKQLAEDLGIEYKLGLPDGESSDADVVVIYGE
jgi:hypothetical protein